MGCGFGGLHREFFDVDADRKYRDTGSAVSRRYDAVLDLKTKIRGNAIEEVLAIVAGLESDQIVGQHRLDQLAMMRHALDHGRRSPGRMQEEPYRLRHAAITQFRAQRQEMVILNPEHRIRPCKSQ